MYLYNTLNYFIYILFNTISNINNERYHANIYNKKN